MIKKTMVAIALSAVALSGCGPATIKTDKATVKSEKLYKKMDNDEYLFSYMLQQVKNKEVPVNDDMKEQANESLENLKANYKQTYGDSADRQLKSYFKQYNISGESDFKKTVIDQLQDREFVRKYVKKHFDEVSADYYKKNKPKKISIITTTKKKIDDVYKKASKSDNAFAKTAIKYSTDDNAKSGGEVGIVDNGNNSIASTFNDKAQKAALKMKKGETVKIKSKKDSKYYVIRCTGSSLNDIRKELKPIYITSPLLSYDTYADLKAYQDADVKYSDKKAKKRIGSYIKDQLRGSKTSGTAA